MNDPLIGRVIDGRYEVLDRIGEGGTGIVYRARQVSVDRIIAVKMLNQQMAEDPNWVQRFYNEARACSRLQHPNTIRLFDFGQTKDEQLYITMEFLGGQSLRQVIDTSAPLAPERVLKVLVQCCASLTEAHGLGIIHRDIKPDNVFLLDMPGSPDFVKVLDFSVAKLLQDSEMRTQAGVVFGTPQYMSPELGTGAVPDARSDLYSLGILAYEMTTGAVPFSGENPIQVLGMHMSKPLPPLPGRVPPPLADVIRRALEKDPSRRFQSAAEMLENCQRQLSALAAGPAAPARPAPATAGAEQKTMYAAQAPAIPGSLPAGPPPARPLAQTLRPPPGSGGPPPAQPRTGSVPVAGPPPAQPRTGSVPVAGPPPAQPRTGSSPVAGPPPAQPRTGSVPVTGASPPPATAVPAEQKTILAGAPPNIGQNSGLPPGGTPPAAAEPAEKTILAGHGPTAPAGPPPGAPQPGAPQPGAPQPGAPKKTMILGDSEGIVSFARSHANAGAPQPAAPTAPQPAAATAPQPAAPTAPQPAPGANDGTRRVSLKFWLLCLAAGLALGLIAYLAVILFGT